jgi:hypothetical protein
MLILNRVAAVWACVMDVLQAQNSRHRRIFKEEPLNGETEDNKQA